MITEWFIQGARTFPPILGQNKEAADVSWLRKHGMRVWDTVCLFDDGESFTIGDVACAISHFDFPDAAPGTNYKRAARLLRSALAEGDILERRGKHWRFRRG